MSVQSIVISLLIAFLAAPSAIARHRQDSPELWQAFAQKLEAGAFVRVHLKKGKAIKGYFIPSSDGVFRLKPKTRIPVPVREFQFSDIDSIDRQRDGWSPGAKVLTGVA